MSTVESVTHGSEQPREFFQGGAFGHPCDHWEVTRLLMNPPASAFIVMSSEELTEDIAPDAISPNGRPSRDYSLNRLTPRRYGDFKDIEAAIARCDNGPGQTMRLWSLYPTTADLRDPDIRNAVELTSENADLLYGMVVVKVYKDPRGSTRFSFWNVEKRTGSDSACAKPLDDEQAKRVVAILLESVESAEPVYPPSVQLARPENVCKRTFIQKIWSVGLAALGITKRDIV